MSTLPAARVRLQLIDRAYRDFGGGVESIAGNAADTAEFRAQKTRTCARD